MSKNYINLQIPNLFYYYSPGKTNVDSRWSVNLPTKCISVMLNIHNFLLVWPTSWTPALGEFNCVFVSVSADIMNLPTLEPEEGS